MPPDPDQERPTASAPADVDGTPQPTPGSEAPDNQPTPPRRTSRTPEERLTDVYGQWQRSGRPTGDAITLLRTTSGTPDALPYLNLLGVGALETEDAFAAWEGAQLASDSTPLGRLLRPVVALVPWGGRWSAARSIGRSGILEPIDHATPAQALAAAEARLELVAARRLGEPLDQLAAEIEADEAAAAGRVRDATSTEPAPAQDAAEEVR